MILINFPKHIPVLKMFKIDLLASHYSSCTGVSSSEPLHMFKEGRYQPKKMNVMKQ